MTLILTEVPDQMYKVDQENLIFNVRKADAPLKTGHCLERLLHPPQLFHKITNSTHCLSSDSIGKLILFLLIITVFPGSGNSQDNSASPKSSLQKRFQETELSAREMVTAEADRSIDKGLAYLAKVQREDGSFGTGIYASNVGVTALSGMAFLAAGHTPDKGRYGRVVSKTLHFLLSRCRASGLIIEPKSRSHGPMYGHGFATLFLAEVYGMVPDKEKSKDLRTKLKKAVELIVSSQNEEGGWRYSPVPKEADMSVTVCQIMALRAARNSGIHVPKTTIDRCIQYVRKCQNPDGGFSYQLNQRRESEFPRSAAGIVALYSAGLYEAEEIDSGIQFMETFQNKNINRHYYYGHYYAVQAMWMRGGQPWKKWYPSIRDELVKAQNQAEGYWDHPDLNICNEYRTAMACLILQLPNQYLPIFNR